MPLPYQYHYLDGNIYATALLRDDQIEDVLEKLFGLENPEESEDEYEEDEGCTSDQLLEKSVNSDYESFILSPIISNSPASVTQISDIIEPTPSCSRESTSELLGLPLQSTIAETNRSDDEDTPIIRGHRSIPTITETSESESESDQDEEEWKKTMWINERPNPERFSDILLQPSVFFPSRTTPLAYFTRFFCDEVLRLIMEHTNLYAMQQRAKNWEPVTVTDIKMVLGIIILMGLHSVPSWDLYWSSDPFFRIDEIARVMTCKRFKKIMENLHLADNSKMPSRNDHQYDKLYKVRPLLDLQQDNVQSLPSASLCFPMFHCISYQIIIFYIMFVKDSSS